MPATHRSTAQTYQKWRKEFAELLRHDKSLNDALTQWEARGVTTEFITRATGLYCLTRHRSEARYQFEIEYGMDQITKLSESLASKLEQLISKPMGRDLFSGLARFPEFYTRVSGNCYLTPEFVHLLPRILRKLARVTGEAGIHLDDLYCDRKTAMSRALVWLMLAVQIRMEMTEYRASKRIASLLTLGLTAAGEAEPVVGENAVRQRFRRFRRQYSTEFTDMRDRIQTRALPGAELATLVRHSRTRGPSA
jgi:hypothetical protein